MPVFLRRLWKYPAYLLRLPYRETMVYFGSDARPPEPDELVGTPTNIGGKKGVVVANSCLYITIEFNSRKARKAHREKGCQGVGSNEDVGWWRLIGRLR